MTIRNEFVPLTLIGVALVALVAAGNESLPAPLPAVRMLLAATFAFIVPGYVLQAALFPRQRDLGGSERLSLAFGLSLAIVPAMALLLDRLPWGIRLWPIVAFLSVFFLTCSMIAWYRRRLLPDHERFALSVGIQIGDWWAAQNRTGRAMEGVLTAALLITIAGATATALLPRPGQRLTEFYILGLDGMAEHYPRQAIAGQPVTVTVGISNREGVVTGYRTEVHQGGHVLEHAPPISLKAGEAVEQAVTFAPAKVGDDVPIMLALYRDGGDEPYRRLRLWMTVKAEP